MNPLLAIAAVSLLVSATFFLVMWYQLRSLKPNVVLLQLTFTEEAFRRVLFLWGPEGVNKFNSHFPLDYGFLTSYAIFGASLGTWISGHTESCVASSVLPWLLPTAALFDATEDQFHQRQVVEVAGSFPRLSFLAAGLAASAKWLLLLAFWTCAALVWSSHAA